MAVATAAAIGSLVATAASTGMSFAQAGKQKALAKQAKEDADIAMEKARKALEINYYASQGIKKEPYELEREALLSAGAQAIEAGVESERGAAATAGRVMMAQNEAQAGQRTAMGKDLTELENKQLAEESRLRNATVNLDLGEAEGAQLAARDAEQARAAAMKQGFEGVASGIKQAANFIDLYPKTQAAKEYASFANEAKNQGYTQETLQNALVKLSKDNPKFANLSGVGYSATGVDANGKPIQGFMTGLGAQDYLSGLGVDYLRSLREAMFSTKK